MEVIQYLSFHNSIKLFHFTTKYYGSHVASDRLYETFGKLFDKYVEVYQGKYGRIKKIEDKIKIRLISDKEIKVYCEGFLEKIHKIRKRMEKDNDLCNILDEIEAEVNRFLYLIDFK